MSRRENTLARLNRLIATGTLPYSSCGATLLDTIQPLIAAGVLAERRVGSGRSLEVRDPVALLVFRQREFPDVATAGLGSRAMGVGKFRDSKTLRADTPEIVSIRCWNDLALAHRGVAAGAAEATRRFGVFSLLLGPEADWQLAGSCAIVENPAMFAAFERLRLNVDLVIYGHGRLSNRALGWLKRAGAKASFTHLPDYDPAGLSEHLRCHRALGGGVRLHLPDDLGARFEHFCNRALLDKPNTRAMLAGLRECALPEVRTVLHLIHQHNAGLEQEALLLNALDGTTRRPAGSP